MKIFYGVNNLRRIREMPEIEIKPLTILVGKNSAGKSTFLRSFPLLRQSFETRTSAPILWYGDYVDFGNIEKAVPKNEQGLREATFSFIFTDVSKDDLKHIFFIPSRFAMEMIHYINEGKGIDQIKIDFTIAGSSSSENKDASSKTVLRGISFALSSKNRENESRFLINLEEGEFSSNTDGASQDKIFDDFKFQKFSHNSLIPFFNFDFTFDLCFLWAKKNAKNEEQSRRYDIEDVVSDYIVTTIAPSGEIDAELKEEITDSPPRFLLHKDFSKRINKVKNKSLKEKLSHCRDIILISHLYDSFCSLISNLMAEVVYLGPARASGERFYRIQELEVSEIGSQGRNFPTYLNSLDAEEQRNFSEWVQDIYKFGVSVERSEGHISIKLQSGEDSVNIADTGYGYSQVLPFLGMLWSHLGGRSRRAGYRNRNRIISPLSLRTPKCLVIEQPELHLHPDYQAKLADTFAKIVNERDLKLVIETHSDALINRLGELIADENNNLKHDDVQIVIFEAENNLVSPTKVHVSDFNSNGTLKDWPYGFFRY